MLDYGSVCSGIEAASVAWEPIGFKPLWFSEIEKFPSHVLAHHWPEIKNLGDMTLIAEKIKLNQVFAPDVLVGGTPCQAFSVAGLRKGLDDLRGQLTLSYVTLLNEIDKKRTARGLGECVAVWENVPGVLSSKDNAFGCFLAGLAGEDEPLQPSGKKWPNAGCVFGPQRTIAWRILDAQYFGVAQRRRRVFVVASARKNFDPTKILFELEGLRRDIAPSRGAGEEVAGTITQKSASGSGQRCGDLSQLHAFSMCAFGEYSDDGTASTMKARDYKDATALAVQVVHGTQDPCTSEELAFTLGRNGGAENAIAFAENSRSELRLEGGDGSRTGCLSTGGGKAGQGVPMIASNLRVRRLTPTECERLQGFPDDHTKIPLTMKARARKKNESEFKYFHYLAERKKRFAEDGPRYKALGNSMAVPCMAWIGKRLKQHLGSI